LTWAYLKRDSLGALNALSGSQAMKFVFPRKKAGGFEGNKEEEA